MRREKNLEEAKKITIKNDPSLPEPKCVSVMRVVSHMVDPRVTLLLSVSEDRASCSGLGTLRLFFQKEERAVVLESCESGLCGAHFLIKLSDLHVEHILSPLKAGSPGIWAWWAVGLSHVILPSLRAVSSP